MKKIAILLVTCLAIASCKSDDEGGSEPILGNLTLDFKNVIENTDIELGTNTYTNGSAENYKISELKYIISNIVLINDNGEEFKYPVDQSYFLVNEEVSTSKSIPLSDIPSATYTKIRFGIGVDQSKYPIESGTANFIPTAEEAGMLWNWSAGYKFIKFEGTFGDADTPFLIHVGSHGATLDNYKEVTLDLSSNVIVSDSATASIGISADIAKIFDSTNTHSLVEKSDIQVDPENAPKIAENINTMFTVTAVFN